MGFSSDLRNAGLNADVVEKLSRFDPTFDEAIIFKTMPETSTAYDSLPYPSYTFPQTHPDRLSVLGKLSGVDTANPEDCRVLELGCGDGTNLISAGYSLPQSDFVGIDLSGVHISKGIGMTQKLGIENVNLLHADIAHIDLTELGKFDFIVAHGLFSWVPAPIRKCLLEIFKNCLEPNGIGYLSYNAYPGCHLRKISSGIMKFGAGAAAGPSEKVEKGINMLRLVGRAAEKDSLYQRLLEIELEQIVDRSPQNVFHDDLAEINQPFYFHEFVQLIEEVGMQFVSESDPKASNIRRFDNNAQELLSSFEDRIRREQIIDLITCRRFRSSLICRDNIVLAHSRSESVIREKLFISANLRPEMPTSEIDGPAPMKFIGANDVSVESNQPLMKAVLSTLGESVVRGSRFEDLISTASSIVSPEYLTDDAIGLCTAYLLQMFEGGLVTLRNYQPNAAMSPGKFPTASRFARFQIEDGSQSVTMLTGANLTPENDASRLLISLLDGSRTRDDLIKEMKASIAVPAHERTAFENGLPGMIDLELKKFADAGLLHQ